MCRDLFVPPGGLCALQCPASLSFSFSEAMRSVTRLVQAVLLSPEMLSV